MAVTAWMVWLAKAVTQSDASSQQHPYLHSFSHQISETSVEKRKEGRKEVFYLTMHSTQFSYGYMASDIWYRTMDYSFRFVARVLLYASSHRQDNTYHSLCYTSCGTMAGMRNSSMVPPWRNDQTTHCTISECSYHGATSRSCVKKKLNIK